MNEQERAVNFSNRLDQIVSGASPEPTFTGEEKGFRTLSKELVFQPPFSPDPMRRSSARAKLRERFVRHHEWYDRPLAGEGWVRTFGLAVIVTVLLVGMVWMIKDLSDQFGVGQSEPQRTKFPVQHQTTAGVTASLELVEFTKNGLHAQVCYQPTDEGNWAFSDATLRAREIHIPLYMENLGLLDGGRKWCADYYGRRPDNSPGDWIFDFQNLVRPRLEDATCGQVKHDLLASGSGWQVGCPDGDDSSHYLTKWGPIPESLSDNEASRLQRQVIANQTIYGSWVFEIDPAAVKSADDLQRNTPPVIVSAGCQTGWPAHFTGLSTVLYETREPVPDENFGWGEVKDGPFTIRLGLPCSPNFVTHHVAGKIHSDISGLGVYLHWVLDEPVEEPFDVFAGLEPDPVLIHKGEPKTNSAESIIVQGVAFSESFAPGSPSDEFPMRYIVKIQTADGTEYGAAMEFTLQREPDGYRPLDVKVEPLSTSIEESVDHEDENIPTESVLVPDSCTLSGEVLDDPAIWWAPEEKRPETLAGFEQIEVGDFKFLLALACDDQFRHDPAMYQSFSEIEGLGIVTSWEHPSFEIEGEIVEYSGFEPYVRITGSSGAGTTPGSVSGRTVTGVQFPPGVIPDFTQEDVRLRYLLKIQGPDGSLAGAAMSFTLQREPDGYRPVDVVVNALTEDELQPLQSDPNAKSTFPLKDPLIVYPELQEITALLEGWERSLVSEPGWIHFLDREYDNSGNQIYGGLADYNNEQWLLLDEQGYVVSSVFTAWADDGRILQQSYIKDGKGTNLTFGSTANAEDTKPYRLNLAGNIIRSVMDVLRAGRPVEFLEENMKGKTFLVVSYSDEFSQPINLASQQVVKIMIRIGIDQATGARAFTETFVTNTEGEQILTGRTEFQVAERVSEPPEEVMLVFGEAFSGYQPADPVGTPAPAGFDPSQLSLTSVTVHGDNFERPGFFYGDISAGGYFLGRVDFGSSPGGWCRRSADGSKLAFKHQMLAGSQMSSSEIRWVDLLDGARVHSPAPDLFVDSMLAWSPVKEEVAFFACRAERTDCGLYLLDTVTDQVRFVSGVGTTLWDPLWSPDGSQVAFVDTTDSDLTLFTIEIISGGVVYEAPFDGDAWKAPDDAPVYQWGVDFSHGWDGGNCFVE